MKIWSHASLRQRIRDGLPRHSPEIKYSPRYLANSLSTSWTYSFSFISLRELRPRVVIPKSICYSQNQKPYLTALTGIIPKRNHNTISRFYFGNFFLCANIQVGKPTHGFGPVCTQTNMAGDNGIPPITEKWPTADVRLSNRRRQMADTKATQIVYVSIMGTVMLAAFLEWFLWVRVFSVLMLSCESFA